MLISHDLLLINTLFSSPSFVLMAVMEEASTQRWERKAEEERIK